MKIDWEKFINPDHKTDENKESENEKSIFSVTNFDPNIQHPSKLSNGFVEGLITAHRLKQKN